MGWITNTRTRWPGVWDTSVRSVRRRLGSTCDVCHRWADAPLCDACVTRFGAVCARCPRCAIASPGAGVVCIECLHAAPPWSQAIAAVDYDFPWDSLIVAMKSPSGADRASALAGLLASAIPPHQAQGVDAVVPIPLAPQRLRARGFNQAWEVARRVAARHRRPAHADMLTRVLETPVLAALSRAQRAERLRAAFMVEPALRAQVEGRRIALVDDVLTTGATLSAAARALLRQGARDVVVWVVARTPKPDRPD